MPPVALTGGNDVIDIEREELLTLKEAKRLPFFRKNGKSPDLATVYRWTMPNGCRGVRLESIQVAGCRMTSREACVRFIQNLSTATDPTAYTTPAQDTRRRESAERELAAAGI